MVMSKKKKGRNIENQTLTTLIKSQTLIEQIRTRQTHIKSPIQTLNQNKTNRTIDRTNHRVGETETSVKMSLP